MSTAAPLGLAEPGEAAELAGPAEPAEAPPVALYVHIPYCVSHCPYCDFVVVAGKEARGPTSSVAPFLAALEVELGLRADALDEAWGRPASGDGDPRRRPALDSLYLGGGTPSLLAPEAVARLIGIARDRFGLASDAEVTLEANPGPDERGDASALRRAGVTRLSIGAQSLDRTELRALGRRHSPEDVAGTVAAARDAGIESVSLDLLYDIPGSTPATWSRTLEGALALEPDHLSLYALTLDDPDQEGITGPQGDHLPVRDGARRWRDRARRGQDDDRAAAMYELADARLAAAGFAWYEISNWARPGHESRHNLAYWRRRPYEALGPGAHAFDGRTRRWNAAHLGSYMAALAPGPDRPAALPPGGSEPIDAPTAAAEQWILGLRLADGIAPDATALAVLRERLRDPLAEGLLEHDARGALSLTLRGRILSNEVFARLI